MAVAELVEPVQVVPVLTQSVLEVIGLKLRLLVAKLGLALPPSSPQPLV